MPDDVMGSAVQDDGNLIRRLLADGRSFASDLDRDGLLRRALAHARDATGARYAAIGIVNAEGTGLEQLLTLGLDDLEREEIGSQPSGLGVLGILIEDPVALRLADVGEHPRSYGFPARHPRMRSFLGAPIMVEGRLWGNVYLTDKDEGEFTALDEATVVTIVERTAFAIEIALKYERSERRRMESEHAARHLAVTRDVMAALGDELELERALEVLAKRGRALVGARSVVLWLRDGDELVASATAGHANASAQGARIGISGTDAGRALQGGKVARNRARTSGPYEEVAQVMDVGEGEAALMVPMVHRGNAVGVLIALGPRDGLDDFSADDEQLLETFAVSAATSLALAQSVERDRLWRAVSAAEAERAHWARELHDETLQSLGGLRVTLDDALRRRDAALTPEELRAALEHVDSGIENLRQLIAGMRSGILEELGLRAAVESLLAEHAAGEAEVVGSLSLREPAERGARLQRELETAVYRVVQEGLRNAGTHSGATSVQVTIRESDTALEVEIQDNGRGFDVTAESSGFGLAGMHERVRLAGGKLRVHSGRAGTTIRARMPLALEPAG